MTIDPGLLDPDERLLWSGRPSTLRYALGESIYAFVFGALLLPLSLWLIYLGSIVGDRVASSQPALTYLWLAGLPFLAVSVALLLSPSRSFYRALHTVYPITDRRAIVATGGTRPRRLSVSLSNIETIDSRPYSDDHGAIIFKEIVVMHLEGGETVHNEGFIAVPELARVEQILRNAIARSAEERLSRSAL
jgi:hypothetical protein